MRETSILLRKTNRPKFAGINSSTRGYHLLEDQGQPDPELPCSDVDHPEIEWKELTNIEIFQCSSSLINFVCETAIYEKM